MASDSFLIENGRIVTDADRAERERIKQQIQHHREQLSLLRTQLRRLTPNLVIIYSGADWVCPQCDVLNESSADNCVVCGLVPEHDRDA